MLELREAVKDDGPAVAYDSNLRDRSLETAIIFEPLRTADCITHKFSWWMKGGWVCSVVPIMSQYENEFFFGANKSHRAWSQGIDIAHIAWNGDVSAEDVTAGAKIFELVPNAQKGFFLVIHVKNQGDFAAEARRRMTTDPRSKWVREAIVIGASFHVRIVLGMVTRALHALDAGSAPTTFLASEAELPGYITQLRQRYPDAERGKT